jgi:tetratricopeptide (TPR) repeat protein
MRSGWITVLALVLSAIMWAQAPSSQNTTDDQQESQAEPNAPPRSDTRRATPPSTHESSSKQTKIDLSPPPGEWSDIPGPNEGAASDVQEFRRWDPHKADKAVEVGDFYFKRGNYLAAASRYREALEWKSNDAIATFRLAEALEKLGQFAEARKSYSAYLKILPKGPFAERSRQGVSRLKDKPDQPAVSRREPTGYGQR